MSKSAHTHDTASPDDFGVPGSSANASWSGIIAVGVGAFALVTTEYLPIGLLSQMAEGIGVTAGQAGFVVTVPGIVAAVTAPLTVMFAGQVDRRKLLGAFLGLLCFSNLFVSASVGFGMLLLGRVFMGVALGGFWTVGTSLGPRLRSGPQATQAMAIILSGVSLGTVAGVPAVALLGASLGWRAPFLLTAILAGLVLIAVLCILPPIQPHRSSGFNVFAQVLARPRIRLALLATTLLFGGQLAAYTYIAPYLEGRIQLGASALSAILLGFGAAGLFGNIAGGWLASRGARAAVVAAALLLTVVISLLVMLGTGVWTAGLCVTLWGFGYGMLPVTLQVLILSGAPDNPESASAILVNSVQVAIGVGSLLGGLVADRFGFVTAFWMGAASALLTAAALALAPAKRHQTSTFVPQQ